MSELHVTFVCSGNICRSPMAEKMFAHQLAERGLADRVRVSSAGTGGWHAGDGADDRAVQVLVGHGYPGEHRAAQLDEDHLSADLVIALGRNHERHLRHHGVDPQRLRMLRSFDPRSGAQLGNTPQALSHLALVRAADALARADYSPASPPSR